MRTTTSMGMNHHQETTKATRSSSNGTVRVEFFKGLDVAASTRADPFSQVWIATSLSSRKRKGRMAGFVNKTIEELKGSQWWQVFSFDVPPLFILNKLATLPMTLRNVLRSTRTNGKLSSSLSSPSLLFLQLMLYYIYTTSLGQEAFDFDRVLLTATRNCSLFDALSAPLAQALRTHANTTFVAAVPGASSKFKLRKRNQ